MRLHGASRGRDTSGPPPRETPAWTNPLSGPPGARLRPSGDDRVVFRGDPEALEFIAFWLADGRVSAAMNVNVWDVVDDLKALIAADPAIDTDRLGDADVPLTDLIPT